MACMSLVFATMEANIFTLNRVYDRFQLLLAASQNNLRINFSGGLCIDKLKFPFINALYQHVLVEICVLSQTIETRARLKATKDPF